MPGRTAKYYAANPEAKKRHNDYQKEYNKSPDQVRKRVELNAVNRKRGTYGNGDGLDASHTKGGIVMKSASSNRGSKSAMPGDKRARGTKNK
jgi:hypothetical protein